MPAVPEQQIVVEPANAVPTVVIPASALGQPFFAVISADGNRGLTLSTPAIATTFDPTGGTLDWRLATTDLTSAAMDRAGRVIVAVNRDGEVVNVQSPEGQPMLQRIELPPLVTSVAVSPDGALIVGVFADGSVQLINAASGQVSAVRTGDGSVLLGSSFSSDGKRLLTWGLDGTTRVWNVKDLSAAGRFDSAAGPAQSMAFSDDMKRILVRRVMGAMEILDAKSGLALAQNDASGPVSCAAFVGNGTKVAFVGNNGDLQVWNWAKGTDPVPLKAHVGKTCALTSDATGSLLRGVGDAIGVFSLALQ